MDIKNGKELRAWRKKHHLTQQELAEMTGYSRFRISHIETGNENVSSKLCDKLSKHENRIKSSPSSLISIWQDILAYNNSHNRLFDQELLLIDKAFSTLLKELPNDFHRKVDYLNLIALWMELLNEILKSGPAASNKRMREMFDTVQNYKNSK